MLSRGGRDARDLVLFGYARLVAWDEDLALVPDILESIAVEEERIFTLALRPGHRWADGQPFTTEEFRFRWEDVANNVGINPRGLPQELPVEGQPPTVEVREATQVSVAWPEPKERTSVGEGKRV